MIADEGTHQKSKLPQGMVGPCSVSRDAGLSLWSTALCWAIGRREGASTRAAVEVSGGLGKSNVATVGCVITGGPFHNASALGTESARVNAINIYRGAACVVPSKTSNDRVSIKTSDHKSATYGSLDRYIW